jgi:type II secretory pathway component PulC
LTPLRLLHIVNVVLAAGLASLSYETFQSYRHPKLKHAAAIATETEKKGTAEKPEITYSRYRVIEQANIFKSKDIVPTPLPLPTSLPPTPMPLPPLQLELKGTTTSPRDGIVMAIIYNKKTRSSDTYRKNDTIPETNGAKIVEIARDRVILDRKGQEEVLELYPTDKKRK